jgi:RNA polymerase sigma-70 factor, ECF subfamily
VVKSAGVPIHRLSDARLVRRSQEGDRDAFLVFLQRYDHRLRGMAYALVTSSAVMDRVLRTAYLRAWREIVRVGPGEDPKGWLYRLAYNGCIDELRREAPSPSSSSSSSSSSVAHPVDEDDPLAAALAALTPEQRVAVVLVDREGFPPEGAARIAGVDATAFAERLAVGRAALVDALPTAAPRRRDASSGAGTRTGGRRRTRPPSRPTPPQAPRSPAAPSEAAEASAAPEAPSAPEVAAASEAAGAPEVAAGSEVASIPEVTAGSEAAGVPEVAAGSEAASASEVAAGSEAAGVSEVAATSEAASVPEVAAESDDPSLPEAVGAMAAANGAGGPPSANGRRHAERSNNPGSNGNGHSNNGGGTSGEAGEGA